MVQNLNLFRGFRMKTIATIAALLAISCVDAKLSILSPKNLYNKFNEKTKGKYIRKHIIND